MQSLFGCLYGVLYTVFTLSVNLFMSVFQFITARSDARPPSMWTAAGLILAPGNILLWSLVINNLVMVINNLVI